MILFYFVCCVNVLMCFFQCVVCLHVQWCWWCMLFQMLCCLRVEFVCVLHIFVFVGVVSVVVIASVCVACVFTCRVQWLRRSVCCVVNAGCCGCCELRCLICV